MDTERNTQNDLPLMHQNSQSGRLSNIRLKHLKPRSRARKVSDGAGLYVLVVPTGGRYWRHNYRFGGKEKTLALGVYPDVSLHRARTRHEEARRMLAAGTDPSLKRRELRGWRGADRKFDGPLSIAVAISMACKQ